MKKLIFIVVSFHLLSLHAFAALDCGRLLIPSTAQLSSTGAALQALQIVHDAKLSYDGKYFNYKFTPTKKTSRYKGSIVDANERTLVLSFDIQSTNLERNGLNRPRWSTPHTFEFYAWSEQGEMKRPIRLKYVGTTHPTRFTATNGEITYSGEFYNEKGRKRLLVIQLRIVNRSHDGLKPNWEFSGEANIEVR